jgi:hypothetical protein
MFQGSETIHTRCYPSQGLWLRMFDTSQLDGLWWHFSSLHANFDAFFSLKNGDMF